MRAHCLRFLLLGPASTSTEVEREISAQCASSPSFKREVKYCNALSGWRDGWHPCIVVIVKGDA